MEKDILSTHTHTQYVCIHVYVHIYICVCRYVSIIQNRLSGKMNYATTYILIKG